MSSSFWHKIRQDFPITKKYTYLDHASCGPTPRPVQEKIAEFQEGHVQEADFAWPRWIKRREEVREKVARFMHADPSEIAFTHSTSQGMNFIAELLAGEGQVLINSSEFPSSTLPWVWRKADMIWQEPESAKIEIKTLKKMMGNVRTIVTSFVQYATGFRQNLEALGKLKQDRFLVINATQGFGALEVDVEKWQADFLCTNSYKWLLGGYGGGILYVRKKWLEHFKPLSVGWRSMREPEAMDNRRLDLKPEASRYEFGCPSFPTIFAVGAAVEYLSGIGIQKIEKRILELTDFAIEGIEKLGFEIVSPREPEHRSGIVVFRTKEAEKIRRKLLARKIFVSARGEGIRIAPHFYNSLEEIEIFLKELKKAG